MGKLSHKYDNTKLFWSSQKRRKSFVTYRFIIKQSNKYWRNVQRNLAIDKTNYQVSLSSLQWWCFWALQALFSMNSLSRIKNTRSTSLLYPNWRGRIFFAGVFGKSRGNENQFRLFVQSLIGSPQTKLKRKNTFEINPHTPKHKLIHSIFSSQRKV